MGAVAGSGVPAAATEANRAARGARLARCGVHLLRAATEVGSMFTGVRRHGAARPAVYSGVPGVSDNYFHSYCRGGRAERNLSARPHGPKFPRAKQTPNYRS